MHVRSRSSITTKKAQLLLGAPLAFRRGLQFGHYDQLLAELRMENQHSYFNFLRMLCLVDPSSVAYFKGLRLCSHVKFVDQLSICKDWKGAVSKCVIRPTTFDVAQKWYELGPVVHVMGA